MTDLTARRIASFSTTELALAIAADAESNERLREAAATELQRRAGLIVPAGSKVGTKPRAFYRSMLRHLHPDEREDVIGHASFKLHRAVERGKFDPHRPDSLARFTSTLLKRALIDHIRKNDKEMGRLDDDPDTLERTGRALGGAVVDDVEERCVRNLDRPGLKAQLKVVLESLSERDSALLKAWSSSDSDALNAFPMTPTARRVAIHRAKKRAAAAWALRFGDHEGIQESAPVAA
jgi:DNA-directed RNA polymerase specialized sigma24 family protein